MYDTGSYGLGRLRETSNANATTTYFYNLKGHVVGIDKTIGTEDFAISYTRDRAQRLSGVTSDWVDSNHPATLV